MRISILCVSVMLVLIACQPAGKNQTKGKLFIIGGGKKPKELVERMMNESGLHNGGYAVILPMSSEEPDSSVFYASKMFTDNNIDKVGALNFNTQMTADKALIDSVRNAKMLYIPGGDQNKFMAVVKNTPLYQAMHEAYCKGALIGGTSAGAAVMSRKMITGNEKKYPVYTGDYRTIEANNIEIGEGMGFVDKIIVDQHFVKRMRMNRLIATAIENPEYLCVGIDETTALLINNDSVEIVGASHVLTLKADPEHVQSNNGLLSGKNLQLNVYTPGMKFKLP